MRAPAMVGKAPAGQPAAPVVGGHRDPLARVLAAQPDPPARASIRARRTAARPRSGVCRARARLPSIPIRRSEVSRIVVVAVARPPRRFQSSPTISHSAGRAPVVEHRLADGLDLHLALRALDGPHEHVVGVVVGRAGACARSCRRARRATARWSARRARPASPTASSRSSRASSSPARSAPTAGPRSRTDRGGTRPRAGRAASRTRWGSRSAARTATRRSRRARPAPRCGSPTGTRSRRSAGTAEPPRSGLSCGGIGMLGLKAERA